jgi:hypothetical protein
MRDVSRELLRRARSGELTRGNTEKGTRERQAVYLAEWLRRQERGRRRRLSPGQVRGHARTDQGEVPLSRLGAEFDQVPTTQGVVDIIATSSRESTLVGRYLRDVRELAEGTLDPEIFEQRWDGRAVGDVSLEGDPDRVLVMLREEGPGPVDRYRRQIAGAVT